MSLKCPKCGTPITGKAKYCLECGTAIKSVKQPKTNAAKATPAPAKKTGMQGYNIIYLVALISLIIVGFYGYRFLAPKSNENPHIHTNEAAPQQQQAPVFDQNMFNQLKSRVEASPNNAQANVDLGNFLFDNQRFDEAIGYYEKALEINPKNPDVLVDAGVCDFNMQRLAEAKNYFEKALEVDPKHANALYNLGVVSAQQGDMSGMLGAWEKLIEVAPESGPAQTARQMMEQVKNSKPDN
jgi:cytochrome c-type biogenesis protein CcmH/NrfG